MRYFNILVNRLAAITTEEIATNWQQPITYSDLSAALQQRLAGNKSGNDRWYHEYVPKADKLYDEHLQLLKKEGLI